MNQKQLEKKVKYWQSILKLDHWDITCELVQSSEDINGRIASGWPHPEYFTTHLKFVNPNGYENKEYYKLEGHHLNIDIDRCVIHELLHCHTSGMCYDQKENVRDEEERCITLIEKSIYDLWAGE